MDSQVAGNESKFTASRATVGGRRHGVSVKTLKKVLKKAGLKTTGKKATLTRRAKKARLMGGQSLSEAIGKVEKTATGAIEGVGKTATGAVETVGSLAKIPGEAAKAVINGKGRRGGKYY